MSGYAAQIKEAETKLSTLQDKLDEIDVLKASEKKLREQAASLTTKIAELKQAAKDDKSENKFFAKEAEPEPPAAPVKQAPAAPRNAEDERKAKLKAVNKKLKQIDLLKHKDNIDADAQAKISTEPKLRKQLAALEKGETWVDSDKEPEVVEVKGNFYKVEEEVEDDTETTVKLPTDPAEVDKRKKVLNKKLQQIVKLKEKGGVLDDEAKQKIDSEDHINQEIAALDAGKSEVTFVEKTGDDFKFDLEKKLKNVNRKLEDIAKLKTMENLDADGKAKVANEKALKGEAGELQRKIAEYAKQERDRVAARLGWEADKKKGGKK